jgi:hypothetical protein
MDNWIGPLIVLVIVSLELVFLVTAHFNSRMAKRRDACTAFLLKIPLLGWFFREALKSMEYNGQEIRRHFRALKNIKR